MPSRASRAEPLTAPIDPLFDEFAQGTEGRKASTTMVFVRILCEAAAGQGNRRSRRADRSRRSANLRHGSVVPPGRHLLTHRPEVRAGRHGYAPLLQGSAGRPDPRRGHHRSRVDVIVHCCRHGVRHARHQHDPVLHLLLDVRLPARRRSDLGGRRFAHARVPPRRHGRPHDARRRRVAAPGRSQPRLLAVGAQLRVLRPGVCLRAGDHHPGRHPPDVQESGEHLLLPDGDERAVRDAADAGRLARRHSQGPLPLQQERQYQVEAQGAASRQRRDPQRGHRRRQAAREVRRLPPTCGA